MTASAFKFTYANMFNPPPALHERFEQALSKVKEHLGQEHPLWIGGRARLVERKFEGRSPICKDWLIGRFQKGTAQDVNDAVAAAKTAWRAWANTSYQQRVALLRKVGGLIEERVFDMAAAMALEVGKTRMEAIGEVQETADLIYWYCDQMEQNNGFYKELPNEPLQGYVSRTRTMLKPYGVWAVIAPFNFPMALAGGPLGAALVTGNTAVFKVASDTSISGWLLLEAFRDAGLPDGVINFLTGGGSEVGGTLINHPDIAGVTFTGSYDVGMQIFRSFAQKAWPRPCIAEMGGKNAALVSRHADLERAAIGIMRSAFGLQGQKCSACSRVLAEKSVAKDLMNKLVELTKKMVVKDPTQKDAAMGPVINASAYQSYESYAQQLKQRGSILLGGEHLKNNGLDKGYFCAPTIATAPFDHPLWKEEMFLPIVMVGEVDSLEQAMMIANASEYGLTAGFFGSKDEIDWFLTHIEAGVTYVNRPQGATTGAWPGYQPFGGWKASGTTGKAIGSFWYLPQYMREQSQTRVD